jgi:hypothetical protein
MGRFRTARFRCSGFALLCLAGIVFAGCSAEDPREPDLILITADRLDPTELGCYGGPDDSGRSLCRLARDGTLFGWAFASGGGPTASAASVLTGLPASIHRVDESGVRFLSDAQMTLAEQLQRAGYATAAFVESSTLNRSRRLDQGFDHYDDRVGPDTDLVPRIQGWTQSARTPRFVWIALGSQTGLSEIDRLVSRLESLVEGGKTSTGVLVAGLRAAAPDQRGIGVSTHRVPIIWRAPAAGRVSAPKPVSYSAVSLTDIVPTLLAAASIPPAATATGLPDPTRGLPLDALASADPERFLLLEDSARDGLVGLVSGPTVYVRKRSPFEQIGQAIPTEVLTGYAPRFLSLPERDRDPELLASAVLPRLEWRSDVLSADSPVPRLEFHLARLLGGDASSPGE